MCRSPLLRILPLFVLALLAIAPSASASSRQWMTFEAPRELLDDHHRDQALDEIRAFGVDRVRTLVYWHDFAPSPDSRRRPRFDAANPNAYPAGTWGRLDRLFDSAAARGVSVQLTLTGPVPRWATRDRRDTVSYPRADEFQRFATAVGRRYGDRVGVWSIWNEPNHPQFLAPQRRGGKLVSPQLYRKLYFAALAGLRRSGNGGDRVLFGETSPRGNVKQVAPLAFLRGALCLSSSYRRSPRCPAVPMGGYAHHAYTTRVGPHFKPSNPDDVTIGVLGRLTRALDRAARAGAVPRRTGMYLTEFGIQSAPDPYLGVPVARQAEYIAIAERIAYRNPRVRAFSQYMLRDDLPRANASSSQRFGGFESGLRHSDGRVKPAYAGFRLPLVVDRSGRSDRFWGRVRPHPARTTVQIQVRRGGKGWRKVRDVATRADGVFTARAGHVAGARYRLQWVSPAGDVFRGPPIRAY